MKNENIIKNLRLEYIKEEHYEDISKIYNYYIVATTYLYETEPLSYKQVIEKLQLKNKSTIGFTIFHMNKICGFCLLRPFYHEETNLNVYQVSIYLNKNYVGKGIGTYALKYLENEAIKSGIKNIIASISSENETSINFFQRNGYTKCGHFKNMGYKFGRKIDNIYYQKLFE